MAKKYSKFLDPDLEVKTFRWPYWLLPLLFVSLLLVLGLFIFITIHSTDSFGCFFHCEERGTINDAVVPPDMDHLNAENTTEKHIRGEDKTTEKPLSLHSQLKKAKKAKQKVQITVRGRILFPPKSIPKAFPPNSHLKVDFEDSSMMDASAHIIASLDVDLSVNKNVTALRYEIKCPKPPVHGMYSVSAVLNMGWKPNKMDWIRKHDYHTDTVMSVSLNDKDTEYKKDIQLAYYDY